jgi:hypothetical protein
MDTTLFINNFIENINKIKEEEFKKNNFQFEEKEIEKKILNENSMEYKKFQTDIKKKASMEKLKPGNISKKEYESTNPSINILEDDIFLNDNSDESDKDNKLDISSLDRENKLYLINDYLQRKNIILDAECLTKIENIIDNPDIHLKKYFNISKTYQQITRISFIKKLENGSYIINLAENKPKKNKKYFI